MHGTCYIENVNWSISKVIGCGVNGRGVTSRNLAVIFSLAAMFRQAVAQGWRTYGTWHLPLSQSFYFSLPDQHLYILKNMYIYIYIYISDCIETVYELLLLPNKNCDWQSFTQIGSGAKGWLNIYRPGGDWPNTWRWIKPPTHFFQTGSSSSHSYFHIFFFIAFLEKNFIRNIIIILCINYTI